MDGNSVYGEGSRPKKIAGLGDQSLHWQISIMSVETGISPNELLATDPRMLWTMWRYMIHRSQKQGGR